MNAQHSYAHVSVLVFVNLFPLKHVGDKSSGLKAN